MNRPGAPRCTACRTDLRPEPDEQREVDPKLEKVARTDTAKAARAISYGEVLAWADTKEKLRQAAKARRYHHGWVQHEMAKTRR